jgi:hypothetical protein
MVLAKVLKEEYYNSAYDFLHSKGLEKWAEKTYGMDWERDDLSDFECDETIINDYLKEQRGTYLVVYDEETDGFNIFKLGGMKK